MKRIYLKPDQTYTSAFELKGPVSRVMTVTRSANVKAGQVLTDSIAMVRFNDSANSIVHLNGEGFRIEETAFVKSGKEVRTYDDRGYMTGQLTYKDGKLTQAMQFEYDEARRMVRSSASDADGKLKSGSEYIYRPDGQLAENRNYSGYNGKTSRTVFIYDDQGRRVRIEAYDGDGALERTHTFVYDENGKEKEESNTYLTPTMAHMSTRTVNVRNNKGDIVAQTVYDAEGKVKHEYTYTYEYDSEGNRIMPTRNEDADYSTEELGTDAHGNWTQRVVYHQRMPIYVQERTFVYADGPDAELVHPLEAEPDVKVITLRDPIEDAPRLSRKALNWVMEQPNTSMDQFPALRYYAARFKEPATVINFSVTRLENRILYRELKQRYNALEVHSYHHAYDGYDHVMMRYTLELPYYPGYLVQANNITVHGDDDYSVPDHLVDSYDGSLHMGPVLLFRPANDSTLRNAYFEDCFKDMVDRFTVPKKPAKPRIHVIEVRGNSYAVVEHPVSDAFTIRDLDVNYGHGFAQFHTELMDRFKAGSKGLVLFHGLPGTGKTYYIRHLLRQMAASKKRVIYMPPNMVDHLTDPGFMTFLIDTIKRWSREGRFCVLLIEDAEPLLAKRQEGVRIQGVTNLLNMTDGLLNDMLNLQIICTFNVDLRKLDSALLRPGRLLARKEFKPLNELDANLLAQRLGIRHHFEGPATLSEIYAMQKDSSTLVHDVNPDRDSAPRIDDIL